VRLIWIPENGEKREFSFKPAKLMTVEAEAIEEVGGTTWESFDQFGRKFMMGNRRATRAALWIMLKREQPKLKFHELNLGVYEVETEFDDQEANVIRETLRSDPNLDNTQRAHLISILDDFEEGEGGVIPEEEDPLELPSGSPMPNQVSPIGDAGTDG